MDSQLNDTSIKSTKSQEAEDSVPRFSIGTPLQLKKSKGSQNREIKERMDDVLSWTKKNRKSAVWSDNSSYLESDDSCDSGRLQIAWNGDNNETLSNHSEGSESSGSNSTSIMHLKNPLQTFPLKRYNAVISISEANIPLVYHKSMARQFPTKERTPEQMELRRRNTEAARVSRAKLKMAERMMQKEVNELSTANINHKQVIASQLVYANELAKLLDMPSVDLKFFERVGQRKSDSA